MGVRLGKWEDLRRGKNEEGRRMRTWGQRRRNGENRRGRREEDSECASKYKNPHLRMWNIILHLQFIIMRINILIFV